MIKEYCADMVYARVVEELVLREVGPFHCSEGAVVVYYCTCHDRDTLASGHMGFDGVELE